MTAPSIARNSFARLVADAAHLTLAFVSGVITARWLEPEGKGAYASLLSLVTIVSSMGTLGLGDAAVVMLGRAEATIRDFTRATLIPVLGVSVLGAFVLTVLADAQLAGQGPTLGRAVLVSALIVPIACVAKLFNDIVNAREQIVPTSVIRVASHVVTLVGLLIFVVAAQFHLTGAMLALVVSSGFSLIGGALLIRRIGGDLRPNWNTPLLSRALRLGLMIELSHLLLILAARVDVLFVYSIAGRAPAGHYSVALTVGELVAIAASAVAFALYPRVARISDEEGYALVARASRVGLAMSALSAAALALLIPFLLPLAFGNDYRPSVVPALILLLGGVLWGEQRLLTRARTARGRTRLQVAAYGTTLIVMVALDLLLIPRWGIEGAAIASVCGPVAGLLVCGASYRRDAQRRGTSLREFVPRFDDFRFVLKTLLRTGTRLIKRS